MGAVMLKTMTEIHSPHTRMVFVDHGGASRVVMGGWTNYVNEDRWWDPPPIHHEDGTNFSFADAHTEYWKWKDKRTIEWGMLMQPFSPLQSGNPDIRRVQMASN